jgi:hypothetical protein
MPEEETSADLESVDIEAPIRGLDTADAFDLYRAYERAFVAARETNDEVAQVVYRLFAQLCSITLRPSDPGRARNSVTSLRTDRSARAAASTRTFIMPTG